MSKPASEVAFSVRPSAPTPVTTPAFGDGVPSAPPSRASWLVARLIANSVVAGAPATLRS
jgi:hypothetical protein